MKRKTAELTGAALDWAVAKADGQEAKRCRHTNPNGGVYMALRTSDADDWEPSTDWSQGGPIIDREGIMLRPIRREGHAMHGLWLAMKASSDTGRMVQWVEFQFGDKGKRRFWRGETALIAAMRCFVASKLGDEVDIPDELVTDR